MVPGYSVRLSRRNEVTLLPEIERRAWQLFAGYPGDLGLPPAPAVPTASTDTLLSAHIEGRLWVAADRAEQPVGFALVKDLGLFAHLEEMDVLPEHARRGLGAALLEAVCNWSDTRGFSAVTLSTFRDVPWNAPFYTRHGFVVVPPSEQPGELTRIVEQERRQGLLTELRVVMQREL
jgi:GNAT superfamily N-acetyltransferase